MSQCGHDDQRSFEKQNPSGAVATSSFPLWGKAGMGATRRDRPPHACPPPQPSPSGGGSNDVSSRTPGADRGLGSTWGASLRADRHCEGRSSRLNTHVKPAHKVIQDSHDPPDFRWLRRHYTGVTMRPPRRRSHPNEATTEPRSPTMERSSSGIGKGWRRDSFKPRPPDCSRSRFF